VSLLAVEMATKRLELIRDLLPHARAVAMIVNPDYSGRVRNGGCGSAGRTIEIKAHKMTAANALDIDTASSIGGLHVDAFMVAPMGSSSPDGTSSRPLAARHAIPGVYPFPDFPAAGGLLSYGVSLMDAYRQAGVYAGRIFKGFQASRLTDNATDEV